MFNSLGEFGRNPPLNPRAITFVPSRTASPMVIEDLETGSPTAAECAPPPTHAFAAAPAPRGRPDPADWDLLGLLREARATRWDSARAAFLACGDGAAVTPASLQRAFRDTFSLVVDENRARHVRPPASPPAGGEFFSLFFSPSRRTQVAFALGGAGDDRRAPYAAFAAAIDSDVAFVIPRRVGAAAADAEENPIVHIAPPPDTPPPFDPEAADETFRARLLAKHESIAHAWIHLNAARDSALGARGRGVFSTDADFGARVEGP